MIVTDLSFGNWLRHQRRVLDLTQDELAQQIGCSAITVRKLEAEERRPSKQIADRLAEVLQVAVEERAAFLRFARGDPCCAPASAAETPRQLPRHNLPSSLTNFIGRERELAEIKDRLATARLVTLTGSGGVGKTRLAIEAARGLLAEYPHGVWLVELAALADPALVPATVAAGLGVGEAHGRPLIAVLIEFLQAKRGLLVVDNCEHVIEACAQLVEPLVRHAPQLHLLATSREALGIDGECALRVPPLSLPAADERDLAALGQSEAVQLFVERAAAALPGFALTPANAPAIGEVCRRLDGIPLALELAAARVQLLRVEQIAARLDDAFRVLTGGSRAALPRHQTLQATIEWSYNLLTDTEQAALRRLAAFAGGWTLEAAEAVCAAGDVDAASVLETLTQLVNKSLVVADRAPGQAARYRLLETTRQYAQEQLQASGEADAACRRHAQYFKAQARREFSSETAWRAHWSPEMENLRAALTWNRASQSDAELGLVLAALRSEFAMVLGYYEPRDWLEAALVHAEAAKYPRSQAWALIQLGTLASIQGDLKAGEAHHAQSLKLWRELKDDGRIASTLERLGFSAREQGDWAAARRYLEEGLALYRQLGESPGSTLNTLGLVLIMQEAAAEAKELLQESLALARASDEFHEQGWALNHLGHVARLQGDYQSAIQFYQESRAAFEAWGSPRYMGVAHDLHGLGETALAQYKGAQAVSYFIEALRLFRDQRDLAGMTWCLAGPAGVALLEEEPERAAQVWGAAEALRRSLGVRPAPAIRVTHERLQQAAREALGEAAFAAAWAAGEALTMEAAIALALEQE